MHALFSLRDMLGMHYLNYERVTELAEKLLEIEHQPVMGRITPDPLD